MIKQKQFLTMKFNSDRLKKFKYNIQLSIDEAFENKEMIALFENQLIDSILDITDRNIDFNKMDELKKEIKRIKKLDKSDDNSKLIKQYQDEINNMMFVPEYITIKMTAKSHYKYLYKYGVIINGVKFKRFNASASQARVNTVLFIAETVFDELRKRTDNGRDLNHPLAPSKLNAYRGLYCSSRFRVSTPRFCVVKDYESPTKMKVNFVTETPDWNEDDIVEEGVELTKDFNRFDGMGLISPQQARKWAEELELDYVPSQFCIRGSFLKGMVCVFDIHKFIKEKNNDNPMIETIYKDENDDYIKVNLNEIDVIVTESQLKLWDSWDSVEHYNKCCEENGLSWGVSLFTPKKDKDFFYENYQFLQTLDLNDEDVINITSKFVNWIKGVTSENVYYTMLFLLGFGVDEERFLNYIHKGEVAWIRALILRPQLIDDKFIRLKVYNLIKKKIQEGSLGKIIVDGNFQVIVSDPYAMMEHVCGKEVKGLLKQGEYYSNYWNERGVNQVDATRSPLTYRSEHVILNLIKNDETEEWYKHCKSGIILNTHGDDTDRFAGSDFDYDILATTSDKTVIKGVYKDELPVIYNAPKPKKIKVTEDDLFKSDLFSFDSIIGGLTNKSTTGYALLAELNPQSKEYEVTLKRIKTITKAQSAQIDKTKIGQEVKGIVGKWVNYVPAPRDDQGNLLPEDESTKEEREFNNRILLNKHPYFFIYLYKNTKKKYKNHIKQYEILALQRLGVTLDEIKTSKRRTVEQQEFLDEFYRKSPVIESDCTMNKICRRIESIDFEIKKLLKDDGIKDIHDLFISDSIQFNKNTYNKIKKEIKNYNSSVRQIMVSFDYEDEKEKLNEINIKQNTFKDKLFGLCSNETELINYIVHYYYIDNVKSNKDLMWSLFGDEIVDELIRNTNQITIPVTSPNGELDYLNETYEIRKVDLI